MFVWKIALSAGKSLVGLVDCSCALCKESLLFFIKVKLDDSLDTVLAEYARNTDAEILFTIFAFKKSRAGDYCLLVVDDSLHHFRCRRSGSVPCGSAEKLGESSTAYHSVGNHLVESRSVEKIGSGNATI